jgi:hypothetical protein
MRHAQLNVLWDAQQEQRRAQEQQLQYRQQPVRAMAEQQLYERRYSPPLSTMTFANGSSLTFSNSPTGLTNTGTTYSFWTDSGPSTPTPEIDPDLVMDIGL